MAESSATAASSQGPSDGSSDAFSLEINCEDAMAYILENLPYPSLASDYIDHLNSLPNAAFLETASEMMLSPERTECFAIALYPILPDIVGRWATVEDNRLERVACALGRLIHIQPQLRRYSETLSVWATC